MFIKQKQFGMKYRIGKFFIRVGATIINSSASAVEIHDQLPLDSPFSRLAVVLCSDTQEEIQARAAVRARTNDEALAGAYIHYVEDFPNGTITTFNQLSVDDRRKYFEKSRAR